jgi:multidrug efflux pump subunit AcrB
MEHDHHSRSGGHTQEVVRGCRRQIQLRRTGRLLRSHCPYPAGRSRDVEVERRGVQQQTIYLEFSQDRLAAYGLQPADLGKLIQARNIIAPGGVFETGQRQITLNPSGQFENPKAIGDIVITTATAGAPLFDFIEEMHEKGEPLERALPDAGIERIRPVMITVGATILALFPLALEGGPLWKPLCYAQIGVPSLLLDLRTRPKVDQMGKDREPTGDQ